MLTRKTPVGDRVVGLRIGADHYLAKPFAPAKLLARIEVLSRTHPRGQVVLPCPLPVG